MEPNEDITQQEMALNEKDQDLTIDESTLTPSEGPIEKLRLEINNKVEQLQASEQYQMLCEKINRNLTLIDNAKEPIGAVALTISHANKYVKEFADDFLKAFTSTGWFERNYDAVCLYDRAHDSSESLNWCNSVKEALEATIDDAAKESPKLKVQINKRVQNTVFTLSIKTPYLRIKESEFSEIAPTVSVQSKMFYSWLKNIESLSLTLRNYWLDLVFYSLKDDTYSDNFGFNLEKATQTSLSQYVESYIDENFSESENESFYTDIIDRINSFTDNIAEIESFHEEQFEKNAAMVKYLTETLLMDYYVKGLEPIYGIYDNIKMAVNSIKSKYDQCEQCDKWCSLLRSLELIIENYLSLQDISPSPELIVDRSNINDTDFVINGKQIDFFGFAKIASGTDAPSSELIDFVASIRNYGFWRIDEKDSRGYTILRETVVSVYN